MREFLLCLFYLVPFLKTFAKAEAPVETTAVSCLTEFLFRLDDFIFRSDEGSAFTSYPSANNLSICLMQSITRSFIKA